MSLHVSRRTFIPALVLLTLAAGCGGDGPTGPSSDETQVKIVNNSSNSVLFARSRPCGTTSWGSDLLGAAILWQGESVTREVEPGCYDFRMTPSETGADYLYFNNVQIAEGQTKNLTISAFPAED